MGYWQRRMATFRAHWAVLLPAFVYLFIFPYLPSLRSPNELCRLYQTRSLVDHGTFELNRTLSEFGPVGDLSCVAVVRDPEGRVVARRPCPAVSDRRKFAERHYYPSKAPLLSLAAVPVYAALRALLDPVPEVPLVLFARLFCTILPGIGLLVLVRRFLRAHVEPSVADAVTATYALGTLAFSYAELFMSHQTTAVLLFSCFYVLWRLRRGEGPARGYALAGFLGGLAVAAEYTAALGLVPLALYGLRTAPGGGAGKARAALLALAGSLPPVLLLAAYHHLAFGSALATGYRYLNDAGYQPWHEGGFLGIGLPDLRALWLSFFSPLRGLFTLSPFLTLALAGFALLSRRRSEFAELVLGLGMLALYAYFTSGFSYVSWGWSTGPRHLTPLVPFLLLPAAHTVAWARKAHPAAAAITAGLAVASILATSAMTLLNYIPDTLTNALWQAALPLLAGGYLPHTWLSLAGVPNPAGGLVAATAILLTAALVAMALVPEGRRLPSFAGCLALVALLAAVHSSVGPATERAAARDRKTVLFLMKRYVPRPGQPSPALWER